MVTVAVVAGSGDVGVAVAQVQTLLGQVETFIVRTGEVQTIDIAQVQTCTGTWVGWRQPNLISCKPDVQTFKSTKRIVERRLKVGKARESVTIGHLLNIRI